MLLLSIVSISLILNHWKILIIVNIALPSSVLLSADEIITEYSESFYLTCYLL